MYVLSASVECERVCECERERVWSVYVCVYACVECERVCECEQTM